ncbi:hypothetical protein M2451_000148 [Dysgonomonas sp. PFB1-18]|uniref:hypothetical protein n=1 Tax=unclassified Dysgonomonas TaxID=2630389 RepID=UPI002475641E|nr:MULTISPECIES: hypothetical protein [unclassified Dysgonomonas]MDH6307699.1 hypothetical protein [Dysgonomonas sp. PF1-14]MDH6337617.1 hypothetical protein [Dysgonomonas sp. PF1-16]MDH6378841.1 hypothetical protein [Dysgonomonas sp. PFB1-18]MDH6396476.1 hypothetical protein [Dysgonomonas sp. PF1-23]
MKKLLFISLLAISATVYGQTETPRDTFPPFKKEPLRLNEKLDNYLDFGTQNNNERPASNAALYEPFQKEVPKSIELNMPPLDIYTGPPLESNTFTRYPFANDYSFFSGHAISDNAWLSSASIQNTYPTLGAVRTVNMNFNYQPLDWLAVSAGPYGSKYNLGMQSFNDVGVNGAVKFILHDRIRLNAYGQYSVNQKSNGVQGPMMGMFPQTYYGGTIEVKITEKFGVEGGIIRELNPFNGKWVNRPYFAPVFYTK